MMRKLTVMSTILMVFVLMLSGCGGSGLSGKYVNEANDSQYLKFSGSRNVVLSGGGHPGVDGNYYIRGNTLYISFDYGGYNSQEAFILNSNRSTISYDGGAFIKKKGFLARHWLKIVIVWMVLGLIVIAYEKITGRKIS